MNQQMTVGLVIEVLRGLGLHTEAKRIAVKAEIRYTHLVIAFLNGRIPEERAPIADHFGVSSERASEIIGWLLMCDLSERPHRTTYVPKRYKPRFDSWGI